MKIVDEIAEKRKRAEMGEAVTRADMPHGGDGPSSSLFDTDEADYIAALHNAWPLVERVCRAADVYVRAYVDDHDGKLLDLLAALTALKEEA